LAPKLARGAGNVFRLTAGSPAIDVLYLVYAELFILDAICLWCTAVHVLALALFAVVGVGAAAVESAD
jgi:uncharacterized membrane protein